jgi:hypothetical protein
MLQDYLMRMYVHPTPHHNDTAPHRIARTASHRTV